MKRGSISAKFGWGAETQTPPKFGAFGSCATVTKKICGASHCNFFRWEVFISFYGRSEFDLDVDVDVDVRIRHGMKQKSYEILYWCALGSPPG